MLQTQKFDEFTNSLERIGEGELLVGRQHRNDEFVFCDVDSDETGFVAFPWSGVVLRGGCHGKNSFLADTGFTQVTVRV